MVKINKLSLICIQTLVEDNFNAHECVAEQIAFPIQDFKYINQ